ncbi:type 4 prepilin-like proteins leader peptide-processing enzyme [Arenimonas maotaiensis]|uniref:Prepilin leader peptidase/N-methyltransferase n=1 Tax=Arenimonas maotaiensis TaxID=1446479 RepID=A0A917CLE9_9GAMM|nr:A24 family peptidase [Arenimonas maotaiensis]GGF90084.1 type 4 prepilin-like proteins leader peptide-processing enzyme [Arenimonas maotaiensis]
MEALAQHPALAIGLVSVFGLLVGSFLNVVILRLPARMEWSWRQEAREILGQPEAYEPKPPGLVVSRSACPHCGHALAAWENIPLLSFLLLRGRCRACQAPISRQYPAVELITGLLFAACAWRFGISLELGFALAFTAALVALSGIDLRTTLLPDQIVLPLLWLGLLASLVTLFVDPVSAILGAAAGYLSLWSVTALFKLLTGKDGMGAGDFKLLAALGAWCGFKAVLPIILISSVVGAVIGSIWLATAGKHRDTQIPFGQYLAIAGWLQFISGVDLLGLYLGWALGR